MLLESAITRADVIEPYQTKTTYPLKKIKYNPIFLFFQKSAIM